MDWDALKRRLNETKGPDKGLDCLLAEAMDTVPADYERAVMHGKPQNFFWHRTDQKAAYWTVDYTGSLEDTLALLKQRLPGRQWTLEAWDDSYTCRLYDGDRSQPLLGLASGPTPEIAMLRALVAAVVKKPQRNHHDDLIDRSVALLEKLRAAGVSHHHADSVLNDRRRGWDIRTHLYVDRTLFDTRVALEAWLADGRLDPLGDATVAQAKALCNAIDEEGF